MCCIRVGSWDDALCLRIHSDLKQIEHLEPLVVARNQDFNCYEDVQVLRMKYLQVGFPDLSGSNTRSYQFGLILMMEVNVSRQIRFGGSVRSVGWCMINPHMFNLERRGTTPYGEGP